MSRRSNGGVIGAKINESSGIRSIYKKPRDNGGIVGIKMINTDLQQNIGKTSGFWNATNFKVQPQGASTYVDTPYSYQEQYWVYPSPYEQFIETGRYTIASGTWNPDGPECGEYWTGGYPWNQGSDWSWTCVGCCPWQWESYQTYGYYEWVYPQPYIDTRTVSGTTRTYTYYAVWDYF